MLSVELALLLVELFLIIVTIYLLTLHLKEERSRQKLITEMGRATKVLSRQEYFNEVISSLQEAEKSVFGCITGSRPEGEESQAVNSIIKAIGNLKQRNVSVRFLVPKFHDRLHVGYLYSKSGAEVRYNNCVLVNDMRYMVVDDKIVLIGVPEVTGEKEPTKKGYRIPSRGIAAIIREHYDRCWKGRITFKYDDCVKEIISSSGEGEKQVNLEPLARELMIPIEELKRINEIKTVTEMKEDSHV